MEAENETNRFIPIIRLKSVPAAHKGYEFCFLLASN